MDVKSAHNLNEKERTEDIEIQENVSFADMHLSDSVLMGLRAAGFVRPSPIQLQALPLGNCGLDLIIQAKSGTGKTCVFAVIALEMISVIAKTTQVLVVAPTREIAVQISQVVNTIGSSMLDLRASTFIGGIDLNQDKAKLKCCHIAIGTPGRLNQLVSLGVLNLNNVRLLVLDEADQLLTGQFKESILQLVTTLPLNKQVLALSATYPNEVTNFLDKFMRKPTHVRLGRESPALIGVNQLVRLVPNHPQPHQRHKIKMYELISLLSSTSFNQCLVFSNSQLRAESVCSQLLSNGWPASYLTGGQPQKERLQAFQDLCTYRCRILVSTDLSARGLDSEHVNFVINLDIPNEQATYMHRIGRAGRFGSKGGAVSIVCEGEEWEAMKAIATLANVKVYIMTEDWKSGINLPENVEELQHLSESECMVWLKMQNKEKVHSKKKCNGISSSNKHNRIEYGNKFESRTVDKPCNGTENTDFSKECNESSTSSEENFDNNELPSRHCKQDQDGKNKGRHDNCSIQEDQISIISRKEENELIGSKQFDIKQLFSQLHREINISFTHEKIYKECLESWESFTNCTISPNNSSSAVKDVINETLIQSYLTSLEEKLADTVEESSSFELTDIKLSLQKVIDGVNPFILHNDITSYNIDSETFVTNSVSNELLLNNCDMSLESSKSDITDNLTESLLNCNISNIDNILPNSDILSKCISDKKNETTSSPTSEFKDSVENNISCNNVNVVSTSLNSDVNNISHIIVLNTNLLSDGTADVKNETTVHNGNVDNSDRKKNKDKNYFANTGYGMWQTLNHSPTSVSKNKDGPCLEKAVRPKIKSRHKNEPKHNNETISHSYDYDEDINGISNIDKPHYNGVLGKSYKRPAKKLPSGSRPNAEMYSYRPNDTADMLKFYINSAAKFTSMVEYCRYLGKMSSRMARFNSDRLIGSNIRHYP